MRFTSIHIIFNPNSTGPSKVYAQKLAKQLKAKMRDMPIELHGTEYAGHGEKIAYEQAKTAGSVLLISSSGDGGYNEVVNGAMRARDEGASPICMVLAAGNANDHSRVVYNRPILESIIDGKLRTLDLLKISYVSKGHARQRYAHSYIGFGLTPEVAKELNKTDLNPVKEKLLALKTFAAFKPIQILRNNKLRELDSLVFTTIGEMAKVLTMAKNALPDDGKFEVAMFPHDKKFKLVRRITKAALFGLKDRKSYEKYSFKTTTPLRAQLDGEVILIDGDTEVRITAIKQALVTLQ